MEGFREWLMPGVTLGTAIGLLVLGAYWLVPNIGAADHRQPSALIGLQVLSLS